MKKGIIINGKNIITPIVVSTICGHWGTGLMPLAFRPEYLSLMNLIKRTKTTELVKSSTFQNHRGNFIWYDPRTWKYVQRIDHDTLHNAYSHSNMGIDFNVKMMAIARKLGYNPIVNFAPDFSKEPQDVISEVLHAVEVAVSYGFYVIEIVPSCPNRAHCMVNNIRVTADCISAVKKRWPNVILIIKKGIQHPTEAVREWELAGMDILHGINTVPWKIIFPNQISPLQTVGDGAISGAIIFPIAFPDNCKSRKVISVPMIFGGGIGNATQAFQCFDNGANAVSICTVGRCDIPEAKRMIWKFNLQP